jgi:hypothetical protein
VQLPRVDRVDRAHQRGEQLRRRRRGRDRDGVAAVEAVREEHRRGVALPDLQRVDVELALDAVQVEQELGGLADPRNGRAGVPVAQEGEVGDGVELEQVRAGGLEEVQDPQVGVPGRVQVGQRVEDVEAERADLPQGLVHGDREPLEADRRVDEDRLQARQRLPLPEPDVDEPAAVPPEPAPRTDGPP